MYKDFETKILDVDDKGQVLVAANAIGNVDDDKDISMPGSFKKTLKENFARLKWFLNHNTSLLIGVPISGEEKMPYLEILGQLNLKKELSRDVYEDYKLYAEHGRTLEHSTGLEAIKWEMDRDVRRVHEWKLWEYSTLYSWGANPNTPMLGIKSAKSVEDAIDWLELTLKKGNYTEERQKRIDQQIKILRSLSTEPDATTQLVKPNEKQGTLNKAALQKLDSILQHLKV